MSDTCMIPKVFLWTTLRSMSTAFERSIRTLKNGMVFHEPYEQSYYYGPERVSSRFAHLADKPNTTYQAVTEKISKDNDGIKFVFIKDMPFKLKGKYEMLLQESLKHFTHTFLIRNPRKVVPSLYRASTNTVSCNGWNYFDPNEVGFCELYEAYNFIVENLKTTPVVIDADDVLSDPDKIMRRYCESTKLPYDEKMTSWQPGVVFPQWETCSSWHSNVVSSSGFRQSAGNNAVSKVNLELYNENVVVKKYVDESMPYYNALYKLRLL